MKKKFEAIILVLLISLSSLNATYPKVALVLSGGGAKGFSQIGVVDEIMKLGIPIDFICGTSIGGLIGGYYALGYTSKDIINMVKENPLLGSFVNTNNTKNAEPFSLFNEFDGLKLSFGLNSNGIGDVPGLVGDQGVVSYLNKSTIKSPGEVSFDDLYIPYKAIAIDASSGKEKILDHGFISDSMRATMSLPVVFPPYVLKDGTYCMDGGMIDNLPVKLALAWGADIIISVDVSSEELKAKGDFSTLSGVLIQTINLTTFCDREASQKASDLVVIPDVSDFMILDVANFDEILQKGYDAFELQKDEFIAVRDEISKHRPLKIIDEYYDGYYNQILDPLVTSVKFVDVTNNNTYSFVNIFDKYIGKRLTKEVLIKLEEDVYSFGYLNDISTVSFNFQPVNKKINEGILEIGLRDWNVSSSKIDFISLAKLGFSSNPINKGWVYLSFDIHTQIKEILAEKMAVDLKINISENTKLNSRIGYQFLSTDKYELTLFSQFGVNLGSLSPANNKNIKYYIPTFSIGFDVGMGLKFKKSNDFAVELLTNYKLISLNSTTFPDSMTQVRFENPILNIFNIDLSFAYLGMKETIFATKGFAIDGISSLNVTDGDFGFYATIKSSYSFELTKKDTLKVQGEFGFSTANYQLTSSYFDLGGYKKVPGYYFGCLTREYFLANLSYQRYIGKYIFPLFLQAGVKFYGYDFYNPIDNFYYNEDPINPIMMETPDSKTPSITDLGLGFYGGIGFSTSAGDIILGGGFSINGNFNIVVEFV